MSGGSACRCPESQKPIAVRGWWVTQRHCNHSAFNGYRETYSRYSALTCEKCPACWRTTAAYVGQLKTLDTQHWARTHEYRELIR